MFGSQTSVAVETVGHSKEIQLTVYTVGSKSCANVDTADDLNDLKDNYFILLGLYNTYVIT